jgi:GNAT superfamily N-acetyltransferase
VDVDVRRAIADDAEDLTALVHSSRAYASRYASIIDGCVVSARYIDDHEVHLAADSLSGAVLGFYSLIVQPPELDLFFVSNERQGAGIGRLLLDHMTGIARRRGLNRFSIVAHPPSEGFYLRMGARRVGTAPARPPRISWARPQLELTIN